MHELGLVYESFSIHSDFLSISSALVGFSPEKHIYVAVLPVMFVFVLFCLGSINPLLVCVNPVFVAESVNCCSPEEPLGCVPSNCQPGDEPRT